MKKVMLPLVLALAFLSACSGQTPSSKEKSPTTTQTTMTTTEATTTVATTVATTKAEEVEKRESYQYDVEQDGEKQTIKETIVYKGDEFLKMELHITHQATEEAKANFAGYDFETVKRELISYLDQQAAMQQLKAVNGVQVAMDVTPEYNVVVDVHIDMKTVDLAALSAVEGMGSDFDMLKELTPAEYILGLRLNGATPVTQ